MLVYRETIHQHRDMRKVEKIPARQNTQEELFVRMVPCQHEKCFSRDGATSACLRLKCFSRECCHVRTKNASRENDATLACLSLKCFSWKWCHVSAILTRENNAAPACSRQINFSREWCHVSMSSPNNFPARTMPRHNFFAKKLFRENGDT